MTVTDQPAAATGPLLRGVSLYALVMLAAWLAAGAVLAAGPPSAVGVVTFVFVLLGWLIGVMLHEYAHALTALKAGDISVRGRGYLTLNPLFYFKLNLSLILPLVALVMGRIGFPGAGVYLRQGDMRSRGWRSLVSLAGPFATLAVVMVLSVFCVISRLVGLPALSGALAFLALLQASAFILNLLPIPGFDGYGALRPFLPIKVVTALRVVEQWSALIVILLVLKVPEIFQVIIGLAGLICALLGITGDDIGRGAAAFFFFSHGGAG